LPRTGSAKTPSERIRLTPENGVYGNLPAMCPVKETIYRKRDFAGVSEIANGVGPFSLGERGTRVLQQAECAP